MIPFRRLWSRGGGRVGWKPIVVSLPPPRTGANCNDFHLEKKKAALDLEPQQRKGVCIYYWDCLRKDICRWVLFPRLIDCLLLFFFGEAIGLIGGMKDVVLFRASGCFLLWSRNECVTEAKGSCILGRKLRNGLVACDRWLW